MSTLRRDPERVDPAESACRTIEVILLNSGLSELANKRVGRELEAIRGTFPGAGAGEHGAERPLTLPLTWFAGMDSAAPHEQLVKGLLLARSLFVVFGESNSGKTFFVLDLALAIASGVPWRGLRTRAGLVVYIAGEGAASVRSRVAAYRKSREGVPGGIPFAIVSGAVDFLSAQAVETLITTIKGAESEVGSEVALVIVDTFARAVAGGDENSAQDVGIAVSHADRIRVETGAAVGFVHHAGKDPSKGARGSSALRSAADTEILVEGQSGPRMATVSKQRDLEGGQGMAFELVQVEIGTDPDDGSPITSCVVKHTDQAVGAGAPQIRELRGKAQRQLLAALRAQAAEHGSLPWGLREMRDVARKAGLSKSTAKYAVDALANSPYMTASVGGYLFSDGAEA